MGCAGRAGFAETAVPSCRLRPPASQNRAVSSCWPTATVVWAKPPYLPSAGWIRRFVSRATTGGECRT